MTKLLQCNTTGEIYLLSLLCTNGSDLSKYDCVKSYTPATDVIRTVSGIWLTLVGILGIFGNLATLTTIPYAAKRRRYGLHNNYFTTTFYILHLAFMDLLHCLLIVLPLGILYSSNSSPFGQYGCKIIIYGGVMTLVGDMLAITLVALSRCLDMVITEKWNRFCDKRRNILLLLLVVWVPSLIALMISFIIQSYGISAGWQCETGGCGFIHACNKYENISIHESLESRIFENCNEGMDIWRLSYYSTIGVPTVSLGIIVLSYLVIWYKVRQSTKYFTNTQDGPTESLNQRDLRMTQTILLLIMLSFTFWLPYGVLINTALDLTNHPKPSTAIQYVIKIVLVSVFESQYAINYFIYVARHEQYRNALFDVLPFSGRGRKRSSQRNQRAINN